MKIEQIILRLFEVPNDISFRWPAQRLGKLKLIFQRFIERGSSFSPGWTSRDFSFTPSSAGSLGSRATSGALAVGVVQIVKFAIQFASAIVLSRLLQPADFGVVAMVAPLLAFIGLFQDLGLAQATIQRAELTHSQASALFWINFAAATLCALAVLALAPAAAAFYAAPELERLAAAYALLVAVNGLAAQHAALLNREMMFKALAIADAGSAIIGFFATVVAAFCTPNYWALFIGGATSTLFNLCAVWALLGWAPARPKFERGFGAFVTFGAGVTGFNLVNYFSRNLDNILIGRAFGEATLGYYDRAYKLLLFPLHQINFPLARVMLPALARLVNEPDRYRSAYLRSVRLVLLVTLPGVVFLIVYADEVIPVVIGERWRETSRIFSWLGFAALVQPLNNLSGMLYLSQGRIRELALVGAVLSAVPIVGFLCGLPFGAIGVASAYAFVEIFKTPVVWWAATKQGPVRLRDILSTAGPNACGAIASFAALLALRHEAPSIPLITIVAGVILSYASMMFVLALFFNGRSAMLDARDILISRALSFQRK